MSAQQSVEARIESLVKSNRVVLFMKGNRQMPRCGFSASTIGVLEALTPDYLTVDVLEDQEIREAIKRYSDWPTIPQLYVDGEFLGGCDIVRDMFNNGELHEALGMQPPDRTPPDIDISAAAAELIGDALQQAGPGQAVHLQIDGQFQHEFRLAPASGNEIRAEAGGIAVLMDVATAPRARGLRLDVQDGFGGKQLTVSNPNAPASA